MLTLVALVLALTVLPAPWGWFAVVAAAVVDLAETGLFLVWSKRRRRRSAVGADALVGRRAVVVRALGPRGGQVKLDGEIWEAAATVEVPPGNEVVVRGLEGLVLAVEPVE